MRKLDSLLWLLGSFMALGAALAVTLAYAAPRTLPSGTDRWSMEDVAVLASLSLKRLPPVPVDPLAKHVVIDAGDHYRVGSVRFGRRPAVAIAEVVPKGKRLDPARARLAATREGRAFLHWARFPAARDIGPGIVRVYDLRYTDGSAAGWAAYDVSLTGSPADR